MLSSRIPARLRPCPPAVPSASFRVLTLSRPCPSLSTLRPALVLPALTAGAATTLGCGLGARPTAPAAPRGGALGVLGPAPGPAAARASPHRPRPAALRPCSRPLSPGRPRLPTPPPHPASCFPPALPACPGGVPAARPHLPGPRRGGAATRTLTQHTHPARPRRTHLVPATRADSCRHPPHARRQGAAGHPEPWTRQVSAALATHVLRQTGHIHSAGSGFRSHTHRTPSHSLQPAWCMSTLPGATYLRITPVYFSGSSCKVWGQGLRSRQNFHTCPFSGIIALQCRAGLQPGTGHSHDCPSPKHSMPKHLQDPDLP